MKKQPLLKQIISVFLLSVFLFSCKKNEEIKSAPILDKVRLVSQDSTVAGGYRGVYYAIQGKNLITTYKVTVNDKEAFLNPTLISDNNILFALPLDAPFMNVPDKIRVVTKYGEALLDFKVIAPPPSITSVAPLNVSAGDIVTITGSNLTSAGPGDVKLGNTVVEIVSGNDIEMKIKVPTGERFGKISFSVNGQTSYTNETVSIVRSFCFNDNVTDFGGWGWYNAAWGNATSEISTERARQGTKSWKMGYNQTWGTYNQGTYGSVPDISTLDGKYIKLSVFVDMAADANIKFNILVNDVSKTSDVVKGGQWTEIILPLSNFGNPVKVKDLKIVQSPADNGGNNIIPNGGVNTVFIDEIAIL